MEETQKKYFTVSELTSLVKIHLESKFLRVRVQGEVGNLTRQPSGHIYFNLKDSFSLIACVMFKTSAQKSTLSFSQGDLVEVSGDLRVYEPRGSYQINVTSICAAGTGKLYQEFERRKQSYLQMGWFSSEIKKKIPFFPKKIAVVTSSSGAVLQDILQVFSRRSRVGLEIILVSVRVQGAGASREIAGAIDYINRCLDSEVILVARGGGSLEDLWAFNEESVVESVYRSKIPVVSAVGHETDFTLCDFVADLRAPTPSVGAELISVDAVELRRRCASLSSRLLLALKAFHEGLFQKLNARNPRFLYALLLRRVEDFSQKTDWFSQRLTHGFFFQKEEKRKKFEMVCKSRFEILLQELYKNMRREFLYLHSRLRSEFLQKRAEENRKVFVEMQKNLAKEYIVSIAQKKAGMHLLLQRFFSLDPQRMLELGYAILKKNQGVGIFSIREVQKKEKVRIDLLDGTLLVVVEEIYGKEEDGNGRNGI